MCWLSKLFKKSKPLEEATMTKAEVIEKLREDILVHEQWACIVTEEPNYGFYYGDYDWHMEWIKVYENAIYYLKKS